MYLYDAIDQRLVDERVAQFRDQTRRFLAGDLGDEEFKALRLRNGLYIQRHAPMLRIAVPYGELASRQLRMLAHVARRFDRGYGHFSTRQNLQLNWPRLEEVPEILAQLATVQMHAIQTSGNCVRNITTDHYAGIAPDEVVDPRVYCEIVRQWSTFHPEFSFLPRKFKIAFSGADSDRVALRFHDIGLQALRADDGTLGFRVLVGGGMGRTPMLAPVIREFLPWQHVLTYIEAILRVYNRYGRRDNIWKARIKILVKDLTPERFREEVEAEWGYLKDGPSTLTLDEVNRVAGRFTSPAYEELPRTDLLFEHYLETNRAFARWVERNVAAHRVPGYAAVTLTLKHTGTPPGDITSEQMEAVADLADQFSFGELRVTHEQNLLLPNVRVRDLHAVWEKARALKLATPNLGLLTNIISCPGGDFCSLANAKSIPVAEAIQRRFEDLDYVYDIGELDLNISGCMNSCGHHHAGHIGILGVDKQGAEFYQISIGGNQGQTMPHPLLAKEAAPQSATPNPLLGKEGVPQSTTSNPLLGKEGVPQSGGGGAAIGKVIGPSVAQDEVAEVVERLIRTYIERRESEEERFIDTVRRIGIDPFKEAAYGEAHQGTAARRRQLAAA